MNLLRLLPVVITAGMLGAHFMRSGAWGQVAVCGVLPVFLLVRRRWVVWVSIVLCLLAAAIWLDTVATIAGLRKMMGGSWVRMAIILGGVGLFSAGSALVFLSRKLRERYSPDGLRDWVVAGVFLGVGMAGALWAGYGAGRSSGSVAAWPMVLAATTWASLLAERLTEPAGRATGPQK